jgi:putative serine protease PepD
MRRTILAAVVAGLVSAAAVALLLDDDPAPQPPPRAAASPPAREAPTVTEVYARAQKAIVRIDARPRGTPLPEGRPSLDDGVATGSGFVIDRRGTIVTNYHVIAGGPMVTVRFRRAGRRYRARIVSRDRSADLALLRIRPRGRVRPLPLGDSGTVRVGDTALAIGNPLGLEHTLTLGVVSSVRRTIEAPDGSRVRRVVQTDAAINPGSSGGPLLDDHGRVIGVNTQSGGPSIGYAVPVDTVKRAVKRLR